MTKLKLLFFVFLLVLPFTLAVKTETQVNNVLETDSLTIVYPKFLNFPRGETINLAFDVLDSNFTRLDNTEADCVFYCINNKGQNVTNGDLLYDDYWYFHLSNSLTQLGGDYSFYTYCNATNGENGFVSEAFIITETGETKGEYENQWFYYFIIIVGFVLIGFGFYVEDFALIATGGALIGLLGGYIVLNGFSNLTNEVSLALGIVLSAVGGYFFIRSTVEYAENGLNNLR